MSDRYADTDILEYNISASQVKTFSSCPLQYWFRYVEGKPATKQDSVYAKMGTRVHETIEELLKDETLPFDDKHVLKSIFRETYIEKESPWLPDREYKRGRKCVEKAAEVLHDVQPEIREVEVRKEYEINNLDIETGVTAKIDLVTDGEIWDWKTGRIRPGDTSHEEKIQGAVYMAAYHAMYGEPPEAIRFYYISPDARKNTDSKSDSACCRTIEPNDENWNYMMKRAKELQRAKKTGEFPGKPGDQCYWCGYEMWCSESPVGVGNVPWEEY